MPRERPHSLLRMRAETRIVRLQKTKRAWRVFPRSFVRNKTPLGRAGKRRSHTIYDLGPKKYPEIGTRASSERPKCWSQSEKWAEKPGLVTRLLNPQSGEQFQAIQKNNFYFAAVTWLEITRAFGSYPSIKQMSP